MKRLPAKRHTELAIIVVVLAAVVLAIGLYTAHRVSGERGKGTKPPAATGDNGAPVPAGVAEARKLHEQRDPRALAKWSAILADTKLDKASRGEAAYRIGTLRAQPDPPDLAGAISAFKEAVAVAPGTQWADKAMVGLADVYIKTRNAQEALEPLIAYRAKAKDPNLIKTKLGDVNIAVLFSRYITEVPKSEFYTVQHNDTIEGIVKTVYHGKTTVDLVQESNGIDDPRGIQPDQRLKIVTATFRLVVDKSDNTLTLFAGDTFMKEYPVGTGKYGNTPVGKFHVVFKQKDPMWNNLPFGHPDNILGTRWIKFSNEDETLQGFGIHGTTQPETIGKHSSQGCVRMYNKDVEELSKIVVKGTPVEIVD